MQKEITTGLWIEKCLKAAVAAIMLGIHERTAQKWWTQYKKNCDFSFKNNDKKNGPDPTLGEQHKAFLVNYVDENPLAVVDQVMESLIQEFEGLSVKKTAVHRFMKEECQLTFKKTQFHALKRNEGQTINKRYEWVIKYTTMTDMDF